MILIWFNQTFSTEPFLAFRKWDIYIGMLKIYNVHAHTETIILYEYRYGRGLQTFRIKQHSHTIVIYLLQKWYKWGLKKDTHSATRKYAMWNIYLFNIDNSNGSTVQFERVASYSSYIHNLLVFVWQSNG